MDKTIKISKDFTVGDWFKLRSKLTLNTRYGWTKAVKVFENRISSRFLDPIRKIKRDKVQTGEGFSITLISVVLLEFLAAFEQGKIYVNKRKDELAPNEYASSSKLLSDFFSTNELLKAGLQNRELRDRFYTHIRCGLVHEARTKGIDVILSDKSSPSNGLFYFKNDKQIILNRDELHRKLLAFKNEYKKRILNRNNLDDRRSFLMKMDEICEIQHVWYFAYGSNMNVKQLNERLAKIGANHYGVEKTHIMNYQFVYNKLSRKDETSKANILFKIGAITHGVAILLDSEKFKLFGEKFEKGYATCEVDITTNESQKFKGLTFISDNITDVEPSVEYMKLIQEGAKEHELPAKYISEFINVIA